MSTLLTSNVYFDQTGSNRIGYDSSNISLVSANVNITGRLAVSNVIYSNAYYSSNNSSYVVEPASITSIDSLLVKDIKHSGVTYLSKAGHNNMMMVMNGKLYTTSGSVGTYTNYQTGRGLTGTIPTYSLENFKLVNFINETGTLTKTGHCGSGASFALFSTGNLYTWGFNSTGTCGVNSTTAVATPTLANTGVSDVWETISPTDLTPDYGRMFIKRTDNYIYVTGYNGYGQLGTGDTTQRTVFARLTALGTSIANVYSVGTQFGHTFFQFSNNMIMACGYNPDGRIGNGGTTSVSSPVDVTTNWGGLAGSTRAIKKIVGGTSYNDTVNNYSYGWTVMLLDDGTTTYLRAAGTNSWGTIGNGTTTGTITTPIAPTVGAGRISTISGGGGSPGTVMCLMENGDMYNWGYNGYGQLGNGTTTTSGTPTLRASNVTGIYAEWTEYVQSYVMACFYTKADGLYGSGYNGYGQLGVGDTTQRTSFTRLNLPADFVVANIGSFYSAYPVATYLAVGTDGRLYAWGYNGQNNVTNDTTNNTVGPVQIRPPLGA
jgi:alpha-tubulin suppressor-like RCC1 family protein